MSKRGPEEEDTSRPPKRPKAERPERFHQPPTVQQIDYARQLQDILVFRQDGLQELRNGIASFKALLESILYHRDEDLRPRQLSILREYLDSQKPPPNLPDTDQPFLGQLWQAWSFSHQSNNDHVASAVSAVLAMLLRTLSGLLDFRDHGLLLCRTVLQHQHLRLVKRGLDAPPHKVYVISPCLRLLTEIATFDGGVLAREVYKRREQTFDISSLRRNLGLVKTEISDEDARRRPSIRTLTVRYILAHLKYLHEGVNADVLRSRPLCGSLMHYLRDDPPDLVLDLLTTIEQYVLKDDDVQRSAKATLLQTHTLERVTEIATRSTETHAAAEKALAWLKAVCTTPSYGILRASAWYPPGTTKSDLYRRGDEDLVDLGLDGLDFYDQEGRPDVRNTTLLAWIQTLRPHIDPKERDLILTCFKAAPELVAAYFAEKPMQLEPKLTNTWIGYASFLFEVIHLPAPSQLEDAEDYDDGVQLPPQTSIMMDSILPSPLTRKVLVRCLNQISGADGSQLISFFAIRILVLAFQKFAEIRQRLGNHTGELQHLWREACERLLARLTGQAPAMKEVIAIFRQTPDDRDHALQREAVTRLLRLYYEVAPAQALEEQFDVSIALATALGRDAESGGVETLQELRSLELEHLLVIAKQSPGMRWFHKQGSLPYSPIVTLLKKHVHNYTNRQVRSLIEQVLVEHDILKDARALDALIASLIHEDDVDSELWPAIDDYFARFSRQPVKYLDWLEASAPWKEENELPSLLLAVVVEQAPFAVKKPAVMDWIGRFVYLLAATHDQSSSEKTVYKMIDGLPSWKAMKAKYDAKALLGPVRFMEVKSAADQDGMLVAPQPYEIPFETFPVETDNHPELLRWIRKDLDIAVEDGDIDALVLCLSSQHEDIRRQAHAQLRILKGRFLESTLEDKSQLGMLIGELIETFEQQFLPSGRRVPFLTSTFAARSVHVLMQPTHHIYPKLNRYLIKSPEWRPHRMPNYWLLNTVLAQPEEDGAYWKEVQWVLEWLVQGTRSTEDVEILRKGDVYAQIMALYHSPKASPELIKQRVLEVLWRTTWVDGGSSTLITRAGVLAWLDMIGGKDEEGLAKKLKMRVLETCDKARVRTWCGGDVEGL